ncbi:MAG: glycosyltransferase [Candidatus Omnitrophota bacterium]
MTKKLNVLMVTESFYPDGIGGAHTYVYNLSKTLVELGHSVCVITIKTKEDSLAEERIEGIHVLRYKTALSGPFLFIRRPLRSVINAGRLFCYIAKRVKFDLINFHSSLPAFGINFCSDSREIPKIYTFHSSMVDEVKIQIKKSNISPHF